MKNAYHVTNENIAPSEVTDNVGDERGDAFRGIPKLSCLSLGSCHSLFSSYRYLTPNLKNFNHTKLNKTS